ncbi:putative glycoprotein endopeptidase [Buchnera aphidicola (Cinara tujafilina)]|uniref:tRNA threonylcarbamoyladenosine biosynthesis protein TsaB n=1 Tax=Buchnera aphidicola (Cinara tujafilina) TaxID=261317 RepID=F7WZD3_9GAMM|nr:tRNA (adenosine(37)-N6)-threonylcarbamoyltransferase complex dimerization subunit type 1 TsaB [Buchnera aphidicola]AEH39795.1 putative glycoprotein endopeptidase [Buchnera aphidicola (Cinara tujafilina)]
MNSDKTILAIDTSLNACSVAVSYDNKIYTLFKLTPKKHEKYIIKMINNVLKLAKIHLKKIDFIACTIGPGSFTGIRIGISIAQTLSMIHEIPLLSFSTFQVLSEQSWIKYHVFRTIIAIKLSKNSFLWGKYCRNKHGLWIGAHTEKYFNNIKKIPQLIKNCKGIWAAIGTIWKHYIFQKKSMKLLNTNITTPQAKYIIFCARSYLKNIYIIKLHVYILSIYLIFRSPFFIYKILSFIIF